MASLQHGHPGRFLFQHELGFSTYGPCLVALDEKIQNTHETNQGIPDLHYTFVPRQSINVSVLIGKYPSVNRAPCCFSIME